MKIFYLQKYKCSFICRLYSQCFYSLSARWFLFSACEEFLTAKSNFHLLVFLLQTMWEGRFYGRIIDKCRGFNFLIGFVSVRGKFNLRRSFLCYLHPASHNGFNPGNYLRYWIIMESVIEPMFTLWIRTHDCLWGLL